MADELARWAAGRAQDLLARAEAEAVAVLRDALLQAAIGERGRAVADQPARAAARAARQQPARPAGQEPARPPAAGELRWSYCVMRAAAASPDGLTGVDGAAVERIEAAGLAALTSRVPAEEFGEEPIRRGLNDLEWLERVARAHEAVLGEAFRAATIVPLRLCTIYESDAGVRGMLERERDLLVDALDRLAGRQEWGAKLLVDPDGLLGAARERLGADAVADANGAAGEGGGAYLLRRRRERDARGLADAIAVQLADEVHARLAELAADAVRLAPQNRDLSSHEGEMLLNGAYLVEEGAVGRLQALARELEEQEGAVGARIELTGPWPPHNFVSRPGAAPIA